MSQETCKQKINNCRFPAELKQRLLAVLPLLDKHTTDGLEKELSRGDSLLIDSVLTSMWEDFGKVLKGIKDNDANVIKFFWNLFKDKNNLLNDEDKVYFLYLVMDVFKISWSKKNVFSETEKATLLEFEVDLFNHLPKEEVASLLENYTQFIGRRWDLLKAVQIVILDNFWDDDSKFLTECSNALIRNKEIIGSVKPKSIAQWISEFMQFSTTPLSQRGSYQITDFFVKNGSVKNLSEEEKAFLTEVLKLFLWFSNPEVNEQELQEYKNELERKKAEYERKLYEQETGDVFGNHKEQDEEIKSPVPPIIPLPKIAPKIIKDVDVVRAPVIQPPVAKPVAPAPKAPAMPSRPSMADWTGSKPAANSVRPERVNVQDILENKDLQARIKKQDPTAGIKMGEGGGKQITNGAAGGNNQPKPSPSTLKPTEAIKPIPKDVTSPNLSLERRGMGDSNTSQPLIPNKPDSQLEIEKKLAELKNKAQIKN